MLMQFFLILLHKLTIFIFYKLLKHYSHLTKFKFLIFVKFKPHVWSLMRNLKQSLKHLRKMAETQINDRLKAIRNDEVVPRDILTFILKGQGI